MDNVEIFPYTKRRKSIEAEMSAEDRRKMRRLAKKYSFLRNDDNVTSIVDVREEQLMNTLGW